MKKQIVLTKYLVICALIVSSSIQVIAQQANALNAIVPTEIIDSRSQLHKTIGGIQSSVHVSLIAGIKYMDACSESDFGHLDIDITWYNASDETGKYLITMMKTLKAIEQDQTNFLKNIDGGSMQDFVGGKLLMASSNKPCVNEITGANGKIEYSTEYKFFKHINNRSIKITFSSKLKPESAKKYLSSMVAEVEKFDFSVYSTTVIDE